MLYVEFLKCSLQESLKEVNVMLLMF